jgi:hypothetical protein
MLEGDALAEGLYAEGVLSSITGSRPGGFSMDLQQVVQWSNSQGHSGNQGGGLTLL